MDMNTILISQLPMCPQRIGRTQDRKPIMCCGFREIEPTECVKCGGFKSQMIIQKK